MIEKVLVTVMTYPALSDKHLKRFVLQALERMAAGFGFFPFLIACYLEAMTVNDIINGNG